MQFISNSLLLIFSLKHSNTLKKILLSHTCEGIPPHMQNLAFLLELHKASVGTGFSFLKVPVLNLDHLVHWMLPPQVFWRSVLSHNPREDTELHQLFYPILGYFILYQSYDLKQLNICWNPVVEPLFSPVKKWFIPPHILNLQMIMWNTLPNASLKWKLQELLSFIFTVSHSFTEGNHISHIWFTFVDLCWMFLIAFLSCSYS